MNAIEILPFFFSEDEAKQRTDRDIRWVEKRSNWDLAGIDPRI